MHLGSHSTRCLEATAHAVWQLQGKLYGSQRNAVGQLQHMPSGSSENAGVVQAAGQVQSSFMACC